MKFKEGQIVEHKGFGEGEIVCTCLEDKAMPYFVDFKFEGKCAWVREEDLNLKVPEFLKEKIEILEVK